MKKDSKEFELITCRCGCKRKFHKSKSFSISYKITAFYTYDKNKILEIEREDGVKFRVCDSIQRFTERGKRYNRGIIFDIKECDNSFIGMRMRCYTIGNNGVFVIQNTNYNNADYPNMFRFLKNVTKE